MLVCWNFDSVKVLAQLRVDLLQDVRVNRQLGSINCRSQDELRWNLLFVKESFDCFLVLRIVYDNDAELVIAERESIAVLNITSTITLSAQISWYFNPVVVTRFIDSDAENATCVLHFTNNFVCAVKIVLAVHKTPSRSSKVSWVSVLYFTESVVIPGSFASLSHNLWRMQNLALDNGFLVAKFDFKLGEFWHV